MRIQHPMRSNSIEMTHGRQYTYESVQAQPLRAGFVTFTDAVRDDHRNRNNYRMNGKQEENKFLTLHGAQHTLLWVLFAVVFALSVVLTIKVPDHKVFRDIYLTHFGGDQQLYYAGVTNPLQCIIIGVCLICSSTIVGLMPKSYFNQVYSGVFPVGLLAFQSLALAVHIMMITDLTQSSTMMLTCWSTFALHVVSLLITASIFAYLRFVYNGPDEPADTVNTDAFKSKDIVIQFWLCVAEDLNTIVCYALIMRAFNAQSSMHDDTATFFDVMCVVVIGFLQHIANILMIFHGHLMGATKSTEMVHFIARTRGLIFFMIGLVVVFLYLRITPTYEESFVAIPSHDSLWEILRVLALLSLVSLNTLHSMWYEMRNVSATEDWDSSPMWKLMTTTFIALALTSCVAYDVISA